MFFFEGASCPVCGKKFAASDDIVACPVCGTPHHRECYKSNGECFNDARHSEGFDWKKERPQAESPAGVVCRFCGHDNPTSQLYCERCGMPMFRETPHDSAADPNYSDYVRSGNASDTVHPVNMGGGFYAFGGNVQAISDNELIGDITVGDYKKFVGRSGYYYIAVFSALTRAAKKISFNLVAFLAHGLWFISRKMYFLGTSLLMVMLGITAFQFANYDFINSLYEVSLSGDNAALTEAVSAHPYISAALFALSIVRYAIMFFSGLFGNHLYMKYCSRNIKELARQYKDRGEYCSALESEGGVSYIALVIFGLIYLAAPNIMMNFFQI